ncbi:MAG: DUF2284 domain-containing protein [Chloroflexota bacterium]
MEAYADLIAKATGLGAIQAVVVPATDLVVEQRVTLKCRFGCPNYGRSHSCPPRVPSVAEFHEVLGEYRQALVVAFPSQATLVGEEGRSLQRVRHDAKATADEKAKVDAFFADWEQSKAAAFDAMLTLERTAFNAGQPLALALRPSRCTLCAECNVDGPCKHPTRLRFSPEAVGVNLAATCERAGMNLVFPFDKSPSHIGILLLG